MEIEDVGIVAGEDVDYEAFLLWCDYVGAGVNRDGSAWAYAEHWRTIHPALRAYWQQEVERRVSQC